MHKALLKSPPAVLNLLTEHKKKRSLRLVLILCLALISSVLVIVNPLFIAEMIQLAADGIFTAIDLHAVGQIGIFLLVIDLMVAALGWTVRRLATSGAADWASQLRNKLPSSLGLDSSQNVGDEIREFSLTLAHILPSVTTPVTLVGCLACMFAIEWKMSLIALAAALAGIGLAKVIQSAAEKRVHDQRQALSTLNGYIEEMYEGHSTVRISRAGDIIKRTFSEINDEVYKINRKAQLLSGILPPLTALVVNLGLITVCIYGAKQVFAGSLALGSLAALAIYIYLFTYFLTRMAQTFVQYRSAANAAEKILRAFSRTCEEDAD